MNPGYIRQNSGYPLELIEEKINMSILKLKYMKFIKIEEIKIIENKEN